MHNIIMGKQSQTINLTKVPEGNYYEELLVKEFTYNKNVQQRLDVKRKYLDQRKIIKKLYYDKTLDLNSHFIEGVKQFIENSLDLNKKSLFKAQTGQIFGETLILDMHMTDHESTFNLIEKTIKKLVSNIYVLRIKADLLRKKSIPELFEPARQFKRVFIIIEQAECLTRVITETLVGHLKNRLADETCPAIATMILFCLSVRIQALPFDQMHCFGNMKGITKNKDLENSHIQSLLLRSENIQMKLGSRVLNFIYEYFINVDASMTSIDHLHCYALFEHYKNIEKGLILPQEDFDKVEKKYQFLCDQLHCLFKFLHDGHNWPNDMTDIFDELYMYDDLSQSQDYVDAVQNIKKFPHSALVRRLTEIEKVFSSRSDIKLDKQNVISILIPYKNILINNKDCQDIVRQLVGDLLAYGEGFKSSSFFRESLFFDDVDLLRRRCITSSRGSKETLECYSKKSTYFGVVFSKILQSPGLIDAGGLCDEVLDEFKEIIVKERSVENKEPSDEIPKKRNRRETRSRSKRPNIAKKLTIDEMNGLAKAIFVDVIDCMEHQGIVKLDSRTKGKIMKRLAWPIV